MSLRSAMKRITLAAGMALFAVSTANADLDRKKLAVMDADELIEHSESGDHTAQSVLAHKYMYGLELDGERITDKGKALEWAHKAYESDNPDVRGGSAKRIAYLYEEQGHFSKAIRWYKKVVPEDLPTSKWKLYHADAAMALGNLYINGKEPPS